MKKVLTKLSIFIPFSILFLVLIEPINIVIPQLNIYWRGGICRTIVVMFTAIWMFCDLPFRKSCCNGTWTETMYNLVPLEFLSMIVFAQYHFIMAVILFFTMVITLILFKIYLFRKEKKGKYSQKKHKGYIDVFRKGSVTACALLFAIPCLLSIIKYDFRSPDYVSPEEFFDKIYNQADVKKDDLKTNIYEQNKEFFSSFEEKTWSGYDVNEKLAVIEALVKFETTKLGIPEIEVDTELLPDPDVMGKYNCIDNKISINVDHLCESEISNCIDTVCHEVYHAYQHYLVENVNWDDEITKNYYFTELRSWRENEEDYKNVLTDGYEEYENQPLEVSARKYGKGEAKKILSYVGE